MVQQDKFDDDNTHHVRRSVSEICESTESVQYLNNHLQLVTEHITQSNNNNIKFQDHFPTRYDASLLTPNYSEQTDLRINVLNIMTDHINPKELH